MQQFSVKNYILLQMFKSFKLNFANFIHEKNKTLLFDLIFVVRMSFERYFLKQKKKTQSHFYEETLRKHFSLKTHSSDTNEMCIPNLVILCFNKISSQEFISQMSFFPCELQYDSKINRRFENLPKTFKNKNKSVVCCFINLNFGKNQKAIKIKTTCFQSRMYHAN